MRISQYLRGSPEHAHLRHKLRILLHFDPRELDWSVVRECFRSSSWNVYNSEHEPDNVAAIAHVSAASLRDYNNLPRCALGETPFWEWECKTGCPMDSDERALCANAGGVVCKMVEVRDPFGWPFVQWSRADAGSEPRAMEDARVPICKHTHFLMASSFREAHGSARRRALALAWEEVPARHEVVFIVESTSERSHRFHCHVPNAGLISGDYEAELDACDVRATTPHVRASDLLNAARREVLEETGMYLTERARVVMCDMSNVINTHERIDHHFQESLLVIDISAAGAVLDCRCPLLLHLSHPRVPPAAWVARRTPYRLALQVADRRALDIAIRLDAVPLPTCEPRWRRLCVCLVGDGWHVDVLTANMEMRARLLATLAGGELVTSASFEPFVS